MRSTSCRHGAQAPACSGGHRGTMAARSPWPMGYRQLLSDLGALDEKRALGIVKLSRFWQVLSATFSASFDHVALSAGFSALSAGAVSRRCRRAKFLGIVGRFLSRFLVVGKRGQSRPSPSTIIAAAALWFIAPGRWHRLSVAIVAHTLWLICVARLRPVFDSCSRQVRLVRSLAALSFIVVGNTVRPATVAPAAAARRGPRRRSEHHVNHRFANRLCMSLFRPRLPPLRQGQWAPGGRAAAILLKVPTPRPHRSVITQRPV